MKKESSVFKLGGITVVIIFAIIAASFICYNYGYANAKKDFEVKLNPEKQYLACIKEYQESLDSIYELLTTQPKLNITSKLDILDRKYEMCNTFKNDILLFPIKE